LNQIFLNWSFFLEHYDILSFSVFGDAFLDKNYDCNSKRILSGFVEAFGDVSKRLSVSSWSFD